MGMSIADRVAVIGTVDPDAYTAAAYRTDEIDMQDFFEVMFIVMAGTLGSSATADFIVKGGAATNAGSHSTNVTGKSITQLTQAGTDDDKQAIVRVTAEECAAQGIRFIEGVLTIGTATSDAGVIVLGFGGHYGVRRFDLASVDEIVE